MAETLKNTTNEKRNDNNLVSSVKKAAAILMAALAFAVATPKDANAQLFKGIDVDKKIKEQNDQLAQNKKVKAQNNETIAEQNEVKANQEKIIAGLRADLGKDNKNPLKSSRSSFAYKTSEQKDDSRKGRGPKK